jgi:hypothetical protein
MYEATDTMAKARITRPGGTTVVIEGSPDEVAELVKRIEGGSSLANAQEQLDVRGKPKKGKPTLPDYLADLIETGFFKEPKDLSAVQKRLAEMGHVYPVTTLSPTLLRRVRGRELRRLKQNGKWYYTG